MSLPMLAEEGRPARPDDDIDEILGASTGEFDVCSDDVDGSLAGDNDLDELLGESTGEFRVDMTGTDGTPPPRDTSKKQLVSAHLAYLSRRTSSPALDDVRARIRALTIEKQKLYRAMQR
ncbi:hypothetical protein KFE25_006845 [Diacronema lutheri]|uniref:Uncharacterized protein n=1 Tax=Diacronema lutheri TaxID=2081491 RepID=A0A8J5XHZ2_DIALT|nr:hypothetical protein KFE25_006845 [Diacronema lutheri]